MFINFHKRALIVHNKVLSSVDVLRGGCAGVGVPDKSLITVSALAGLTLQPYE